MKRVINLDNWNRKEHFKFFSALDDPFWGITTTVDFTSIYQQSKNMEVSFFLYSVHFLLKCINATTAFKLRIENGEVVEYDKINISPTIGREDGTFGFGFFEYDTDLSLFIENAEKEIHRVKNSTGLSFSKDTARADVIRYSALPWFAFSEMKHAGSIQTGDSIPKISTGKLIQEKNSTGLSFSKDTARADVIRYSALPWFAFSEMKHAGSIQTGDSIPKISTGKLIQEKKKLLLPISISVHHGLVDGRNVAEFIQNVKDGQNNTL